MDFGTVMYESKDRVATITLNRPERFNAISEAMPEDIASAFAMPVMMILYMLLYWPEPDTAFAVDMI